MQVRIQALLNVQFGLAECNEYEKSALTSDRAEPLNLRAPWTAGVPLVLLDINYRPHTTAERPTSSGDGRILWLRPSSEWEYLESLHSIGVISIAVRED
ncbi:hypothetical protein FNH09_05295 [Streptomyces adustus]|uniref:Uncharacterized protein n=1 Tax=Streptomyces adustus TaxID=1609272 RepID=A0A5N8V9Q4_9ACTN|nr:hypothetical protein [Streptomyces adustus]MPY30748.1 hypothetical protein [Streptomyces adustus]